VIRAYFRVLDPRTATFLQIYVKQAKGCRQSLGDFQNSKRCIVGQDSFRLKAINGPVRSLTLGGSQAPAFQESLPDMLDLFTDRTGAERAIGGHPTQESMRRWHAGPFTPGIRVHPPQGSTRFSYNGKSGWHAQFSDVPPDRWGGLPHTTIPSLTNISIPTETLQPA